MVLVKIKEWSYKVPMGTGKGGRPAKICVERGCNKSCETQKGEVTVENLVPSSALGAKGRAGNQAMKS